MCYSLRTISVTTDSQIGHSAKREVIDSEHEDSTRCDKQA